MTAPKTGDLRVWYTILPPRQALRINVRNMAEALAVLGALEAVTAYETVHGVRTETAAFAGVSRYELDEDGDHAWFDVEDWELTAVQDVLDAA